MTSIPPVPWSEGIARHPDKPCLALVFQLLKGGEAVLEYGAQRNPFDAVQLEDVDVVGAHPTQALLHAGTQPLRREIEAVTAESARLGREDDAVAAIG
jgi:hypothetical protein